MPLIGGGTKCDGQYCGPTRPLLMNCGFRHSEVSMLPLGVRARTARSP